MHESITMEPEPVVEESVMGAVQLQNTISLETQESITVEIQPAGSGQNVVAVEVEKASNADSSFSEGTDEDNLDVDEGLNEDILDENDDENMMLEDSNRE